MGSREQSSREADAPQAQQERNGGGGGGGGGGSRGGGGGGGGACEVSSHEGAAPEPMNADGLASARSTGSNNWRSPPLNRPAAIARPQLGRSASKLLSEMGLRGVGDLVAEAVARSSSAVVFAPSRASIFTGLSPWAHGIGQTDGFAKLAADRRMRWLAPAAEGGPPSLRFVTGAFAVDGRSHCVFCVVRL